MSTRTLPLVERNHDIHLYVRGLLNHRSKVKDNSGASEPGVPLYSRVGVITLGAC